MHPILLDAAGHRRQPVTLPGYHVGRPPRNKGQRYPADPPTVEEIMAVMRTAGADPEGVRLRALIVVLWRAGLPVDGARRLQSGAERDPQLTLSLSQASQSKRWIPRQLVHESMRPTRRERCRL